MAYEKVDWNAIWMILRRTKYRLMKTYKRLYEGSYCCMGVGGLESEWFQVKVGLRKEWAVPMVI